MGKPTHIRAWRKKLGLTQEQLAARIDMSISSVSKIETGKTNYTQETLEALAYAMGRDPADLLRAPPDADAPELWSVVQGMGPEQREQALRIIRALTDAA